MKAINQAKFYILDLVFKTETLILVCLFFVYFIFIAENF